MRWSEEVVLLLEEMRRVLAYFKWHEYWWLERRDRWEGLTAPQAEGISAYAERQAELRRNLSDEFRRLWTYVTGWVDMHDHHDDVFGLDKEERHDVDECMADSAEPIGDAM